MKIHPNKENNTFKMVFLEEKSISMNGFALHAPDDSLEPMFSKDTLLIFDSEKKPKDRDYVLAYLSEKNEFLCNRVFIENKKYYFKVEQSDLNLTLVNLEAPSNKIIATLIEARIRY